MAEYHVGCGLFGIYAGKLNKDKTKWLDKREVTTEAVDSVLQWMVGQIKEGESTYGITAKLRNGKYVQMEVEVTDECPKGAKGLLAEAEKETG